MRKSELNVPNVARTASPEPQFDRVAQQEQAWFRRLMLVVTVGLGPGVILAFLGDCEAVATAFFVSLGAGFFIVTLYGNWTN